MFINLGDFQFSLDTAKYSAENRSDAWNWAEQKVVGSAPVSQFVGENAPTRQLSGIIYPHYRGGLGQVEAMRKEARGNEPLLLVESDSDGQASEKGYWTITSIGESRAEFTPDGYPRKISFNLSIKYYGDQLPNR